MDRALPRGYVPFCKDRAHGEQVIGHMVDGSGCLVGAFTFFTQLGIGAPTQRAS